tara:strand:- start:1066 stop:1272 length:207 start_codon:yes stop_codon:yes gene_type:complete
MNYLDIIFLLNIMLIATYNTALYKDVRNVYGDAINKNILIFIVTFVFFIELVLLITLFKLIHILVENI